MLIWLIVIAAIIVMFAVASLAHRLLVSARKRRSRLLAAEMRATKLPMTRAAFMANFGRALTDKEIEFIGRMREIFGRVVPVMDPAFLYPRDSALQLFGPKLINGDAAAIVVAEMDAGSLILDYDLDLKRARNFQLYPLTLAEFIDSLIAASNLETGRLGQNENRPPVWAEAYNIRLKDQPLAQAALQALGKCLRIDQERLSLETAVKELKPEIEPAALPEEEFLLELALFPGQAPVKKRPGRPYWLPPDARRQKGSPPAPTFPHLGDWIYWLIYTYLRPRAMPPIYGDASGGPDSGFKPADLQGARAFNIQPRHIPLMIAVRQALAEVSGLNENLLNCELSNDDLFSLNSEYIEPVEWVMALEEILGVGINDDAYQNILDFSMPSKGQLPRPYECFGGWLHWLIYVWLREARIYVDLGPEKEYPWVRISGRTYLASWNFSPGPFGAGWSRFNKAPTA